MVKSKKSVINSNKSCLPHPTQGSINRAELNYRIIFSNLICLVYLIRIFSCPIYKLFILFPRCFDQESHQIPTITSSPPKSRFVCCLSVSIGFLNLIIIRWHSCDLCFLCHYCLKSTCAQFCFRFSLLLCLHY